MVDLSNGRSEPRAEIPMPKGRRKVRVMVSLDEREAKALRMLAVHEGRDPSDLVADALRALYGGMELPSVTYPKKVAEAVGA
jgi:hypothetical protein